MTAEDVNNTFGYTPTTDPTRYAYYPSGTSVSGTIEYNGKTYTKTAHADTTAIFYTSDGGGIEKTDGNGYTYRTPEADNPVYVTSSWYSYDPINHNHAEDPSVTVGSLLGESLGWLATPSVYVDSTFASNLVRNANLYTMNGGLDLAYSYGREDSLSYGLRPLVYLSSSELQVVGGDGTSESPWQISK